MQNRRLISPEYAELNKRLHIDRPDYGSHAAARAPLVLDLIKQNRFSSVLDFGCGKGALRGALLAEMPDLTVLEFDPAVSGKDVLPTATVDLVTCLDMMEHVEPEYRDAVLSTIRDLQSRAALFIISTRAANKTLPDGRNAHLIVESADIWVSHLSRYFEQVYRQDAPTLFIYVGKPLAGP